MLHETSNLDIKLHKDKSLLQGYRGSNWGTEAEQKQVVTPKDMFKLVLRSGQPANSNLSKYGEYDITASLIEIDETIRQKLTAQKEVVSMGDFKDKGGTPTVLD